MGPALVVNADPPLLSCAVAGVSFEAAVLAGLAEDGGLFVPKALPQLSPADLERLRPLKFVDLAYEIASMFISAEEIPAADLRVVVDVRCHSRG